MEGSTPLLGHPHTRHLCVCECDDDAARPFLYRFWLDLAIEICNHHVHRGVREISCGRQKTNLSFHFPDNEFPITWNVLHCQAHNSHPSWP